MATKRIGCNLFIKVCVIAFVASFISAAVSVQAADDQKIEQFMGALEQGNMDQAKKMLTEIDPNYKMGGSFPLVIAVAGMGEPSMMKVLVDKGVNVNAAGPGGETALMSAARAGSPEVVQMLLEKGANVAAKDNNGVTALKTIEGHLKVKELLVKHGAKE